MRETSPTKGGTFELVICLAIVVYLENIYYSSVTLEWLSVTLPAPGLFVNINGAIRDILAVEEIRRTCKTQLLLSDVELMVSS